jgi:hypothetical protein
MINVLPSIGMSLSWLREAHEILRITVICERFVCDYIKFVLPQIQLYVADSRRGRESFEHLIVPIPQFGFVVKKVFWNQWDSYPCGSYFPFIHTFNEVQYRPSDPIKVLFLTRARGYSGHRILGNEELLLHHLKQIKGHQITLFRHTTIEEDAKAFNEADVVVGLHGGAFSNIVYCRRQTIVIEMNIPEEPGRQCFGYMSHNLQLRYHRYGLTQSDYLSKISNFYDTFIQVDVEKFTSFYVKVVFGTISNMTTTTTSQSYSLFHQPPQLPFFRHGKEETLRWRMHSVFTDQEEHWSGSFYNVFVIYFPYLFLFFLICWVWKRFLQVERK